MKVLVNVKCTRTEQYRVAFPSVYFLFFCRSSPCAWYARSWRPCTEQRRLPGQGYGSVFWPNCFRTDGVPVDRITTLNVVGIRLTLGLYNIIALVVKDGEKSPEHRYQMTWGVEKTRAYLLGAAPNFSMAHRLVI